MQVSFIPVSSSSLHIIKIILEVRNSVAILTLHTITYFLKSKVGFPSSGMLMCVVLFAVYMGSVFAMWHHLTVAMSSSFCCPGSHSQSLHTTHEYTYTYTYTHTQILTKGMCLSHPASLCGRERERPRPRAGASHLLLYTS